MSYSTRTDDLIAAQELIKELEAENRYLRLEAEEDESLIDKLAEESDRLREALQKLNAAIDYHWNDTINVNQRMPDAHAKMIERAQQIAKKALEETT